jgi:2-keto-4-pentenoate hydratase/2-oxohepta-3-ene-1,7-dioic acid hydratase in catechol pathway
MCVATHLSLHGTAVNGRTYQSIGTLLLIYKFPNHITHLHPSRNVTNGDMVGSYPPITDWGEVHA